LGVLGCASSIALAHALNPSRAAQQTARSSLCSVLGGALSAIAILTKTGNISYTPLVLFFFGANRWPPAGHIMLSTQAQ